MGLRVWVLLSFLVLIGCARAVPENVAATVNGRAITYEELDRKYLAAQLASATVQSSDDHVTTQKLEVLRTLIDGEIMLQRAEREGMLALDAEVEARFNEMRTPYSEVDFQKQLEKRHMTVEDLKAHLRREVSADKLLNKETTAKISVSDKDISDYYTANQASFRRAEPQLHLAQILVTPTADRSSRNLSGTDAVDDAEAERKIHDIARRLQNGEDFSQLAQNYSEDTSSAAAGGDLGFILESSLEQANIELRKTILALRPGQVTTVLKTPEGYRILKLVTREPAGQRALSDPNVQQTIRETLRTRKEQLLRSAFYEVARNEAQVVNYFAQSVVGRK
jgi:peptidyl-prolyl cis-trans isomerase SurA